MILAVRWTSRVEVPDQRISVLFVGGRRWTDEQLKHALPRSNTVGEVLRRLGLKPCGSTSRRVRERAEALGLAVELWDEGARARSWTPEQLAVAVSASHSPAEALRRLGLRPRGGNYKQLRGYVEEFGLDTSHWRVRRRRRTRPTWTNDDLRRCVDQSTSMAQVLRGLGYSERGGGTRDQLKRRIALLDLDTSHWTGQGHLKGKPAPWVTARRTPLESLLVEGRPTSTANLRRRLIEEGLLADACARCGLEAWHGEPLTMHLDHVNGDNHDNRLENLRLLCPNCHSQTDSYRGRNWGRYLGRPAED